MKCHFSNLFFGRRSAENRLMSNALNIQSRQTNKQINEQRSQILAKLDEEK